MELIFKMQLLTIAIIIGVTIYVFIKMILFQLPPSQLAVVMILTTWILTIKFNTVWKELWSKWTRK